VFSYVFCRDLLSVRASYSKSVVNNFGLAFHVGELLMDMEAGAWR